MHHRFWGGASSRSKTEDANALGMVGRRYRFTVTGSSITLRECRVDDHGGWSALDAAYREFYGLVQDSAVVAQVWDWIQDPSHEVSALVAVTADGDVVGLAHHRRFARPSSGTTGIYLDDLMIHPDPATPASVGP